MQNISVVIDGCLNDIKKKSADGILTEEFKKVIDAEKAKDVKLIKTQKNLIYVYCTDSLVAYELRCESTKIKSNIQKIVDYLGLGIVIKDVRFKVKY